ncbi:MAG TPA: alanine--glyoxylate aminotransferase family protein [Blastocatellia bacterium]|nr:alanine--glyoxylate aminotransferase family protein [Blastocatellia bacterium]
MSRHHDEFHPPNRILLGPGPSPVDPRVYQAMCSPVLGHLDPVFLQCMDDIQILLREVFETENKVTFPVSGTGSAGMEAALVNILEPTDEAVIFTAGVFSERMLEIASRCCKTAHQVKLEWGNPVRGSDVTDAIEKYPNAKVFCMVHAETSTGACTPLDEIHQALKGTDRLLVVDAVASLGGHRVEVDKNGIDVCYSGSQKAISAPPGLAPITFSAKALEKMRNRKTKVQSWYLDASMVEKYWGVERTYHHTAPISMNYALREALRIVLEEGLETRAERHKTNHLAMVAGLDAMGIKAGVAPEFRAWTVMAAYEPDGVDELKVRQRLLNEFNIEIAGGLGPLKGKIWRIGLMGSGSTKNNVLLLLSALETILADQGYKAPGAALEGANRVYSA